MPASRAIPRTSIAPRRAVAGLATLLVALLVAPGCDSDLDLQNAVPRVTWVAVEPVDGALNRLYVWLSDAEGDSVDLEASWVDASGVATPITLAPGGYGLIGLPTRAALFDPAGQPHLVLWDISAIPSGSVRLRFSPDDRPREADAGRGETVETEAFELTVGMPEPSRVSPVP